MAAAAGLGQQPPAGPPVIPNQGPQQAQQQDLIPDVIVPPPVQEAGANNPLQRPVEVILARPANRIDVNQINEVLLKDPNAAHSYHSKRALMFKVLYGVALFVYAALAITATVLVGISDPASLYLVIFPAVLITSVYLSAMDRWVLKRAQNHDQLKEAEGGAAQKLKEINARQPNQLLGRIQRPDLVNQELINTPAYQDILKRGLARVEYHQQQQADFIQKHTMLMEDLNQYRAGQKPGANTIRHKQLQILNNNDERRLAKLKEAYFLLALADPSMKQDLGDLVTVRDDLLALSDVDGRIKALADRMIAQRFEDPQADRFLTINDAAKSQLSVADLNNLTATQIAARLAQALPGQAPAAPAEGQNPAPAQPVGQPQVQQQQQPDADQAEPGQQQVQQQQQPDAYQAEPGQQQVQQQQPPNAGQAQPGQQQVQQQQPPNAGQAQPDQQQVQQQQQPDAGQAQPGPQQDQPLQNAV